jgi:hypothetical protein
LRPLCFLLAAAVALAITCKQVEKYVTSEPRSKNEQYGDDEIGKITGGARFDLTLAEFVKEQRQLIGKRVSVIGTIADPIFIMDEKSNALEIQCREHMRDSFRVVIEFKQPLPKQTDIVSSAHYLGYGRQLRVFGTFVGNKEYVSLDGLTWRVPTIHPALLYDAEDVGFREPLWIVDSLRTERSREGEVSIDTMKVFWEKEPDSAAVRKK